MVAVDVVIHLLRGILCREVLLEGIKFILDLRFQGHVEDGVTEPEHPW